MREITKHIKIKIADGNPFYDHKFGLEWSSTYAEENIQKGGTLCYKPKSTIGI